MKPITLISACCSTMLLLASCDDSSSVTTKRPAKVSAATTKLPSDIQPVKLEFLRVHLQSFHLIAEGGAEVLGYRPAYQELHNAEDGTPLLDNDG